MRAQPADCFADRFQGCAVPGVAASDILPVEVAVVVLVPFAGGHEVLKDEQGEFIDRQVYGIGWRNGEHVTTSSCSFSDVRFVSPVRRSGNLSV